MTGRLWNEQANKIPRTEIDAYTACISVFHRALLIVFFFFFCNIHQGKTSLLHFTFCIIEAMNDFFKKKNKKRKKIKEKHLACIIRLFKVDQQEKLKKRGGKRKKRKKCMNETLWCFAWLLFNGVIEMVLSFFFMFFKESRYACKYLLV